MLLKPYGQVMQEEDPYLQSHVGEVLDNNDPLKLKRVKVNIELWGYMTTEELPWVKQAGDGTKGNSPSNSQHDIPEIGSQVRVIFPTGNAEDPQYTGVETTEENKCSLFDEDYPNTYGSKDSAGSFTMTNKRTGITVYQHKSGTNIQMEDDGTVTLTMPSGSYAYCDRAGNWFFKGPSMTVTMDDTIKLAANQIDLMADKINLYGQAVGVKADKILDITSGGAVSINAGSGILLNSSRTTACGALEVEKGANGNFIDMLGGEMYEFSKGILVHCGKG